MSVVGYSGRDVTPSRPARAARASSIVAAQVGNDSGVTRSSSGISLLPVFNKTMKVPAH